MNVLGKGVVYLVELAASLYLGKDGAALRNGMNVADKVVFGLQAANSVFNAGSAMYDDDANKWLHTNFIARQKGDLTILL